MTSYGVGFQAMRQVKHGRSTCCCRDSYVSCVLLDKGCCTKRVLLSRTAKGAAAHRAATAWEPAVTLQAQLQPEELPLQKQQVQTLLLHVKQLQLWLLFLLRSCRSLTSPGACSIHRTVDALLYQCLLTPLLNDAISWPDCMTRFHDCFCLCCSIGFLYSSRLLVHTPLDFVRPPRALFQ